MKTSLTIGELSRLSGVAVKTLRFWSDEGLLPPQARSKSGYRLYAEAATQRVDLVRTLRDAGLGLDAIKRVLQNDLSLGDALRLQLTAVEAHACSLQRVAAALRAALRCNEPNETDLRRLYAVTQLTNDERIKLIERFYERASKGLPMEEVWQRKLSSVSSLKLPDNPTPEQLDAWIELAELLNDESFEASLRSSAREAAEAKLDMQKLRVVNETAAHAAAAARSNGKRPDSETGRAVVLTFIEGIADASGKPNTQQLRDAIYQRYLVQDARLPRYWELLGIMTGSSPIPGSADDWRFIADAIKRHLAPCD